MKNILKQRIIEVAKNYHPVLSALGGGFVGLVYGAIDASPQGPILADTNFDEILFPALLGLNGLIHKIVTEKGDIPNNVLVDRIVPFLAHSGAGYVGYKAGYALSRTILSSQ